MVVRVGDEVLNDLLSKGCRVLELAEGVRSCVDARHVGKWVRVGRACLAKVASHFWSATSGGKSCGATCRLRIVSGALRAICSSYVRDEL